MFQTDLLSIIRNLNTVFTATGICHTSYVDCLLVRLVPTSLDVNVRTYIFLILYICDTVRYQIWHPCNISLELKSLCYRNVCGQCQI